MISVMKVLIIGGGGREHALGWKLKQSKKVSQLFFAPGNGGTEELGKNIAISPTDINNLVMFAREKLIDLTVVGVDDALAAGVTDEFRRSGLRIFGPDKHAAQIESSKSFAKELMLRLNIPTASFRVFTDYYKALDYLSKQEFPLVLKASGLALGKGVSICNSLNEAQDWLKRVMLEHMFGESGNTVIIEEYLTGYELSVHAICDGKNFELFPISQDNKAIYDGDKGPNTGGMGVVAPVDVLSAKDLTFIGQKIVKPIIDELANAGHPFIGCLYPGLMITKKGIKVIEYNARFGDPECQTYMRLLESDLFDVLWRCTEENLSETELVWKNGYGICVTLASAGYPFNTQTERAVKGVKSANHKDNVVIFHAGTKREEKTLLSSGGRVLSVTAYGNSIEEARDKAYSAIKKIEFSGMQYRNDIGLPKNGM